MLRSTRYYGIRKRKCYFRRHGHAYRSHNSRFYALPRNASDKFFNCVYRAKDEVSSILTMMYALYIILFVLSFFDGACSFGILIMIGEPTLCRFLFAAPNIFRIHSFLTDIDTSPTTLFATSEHYFSRLKLGALDHRLTLTRSLKQKS